MLRQGNTCRNTLQQGGQTGATVCAQRCCDLLRLNPRPNDPNIATQHIATLIVGCNMLRAFGHPVATCCDMLGVVGSNLKMFKFFTQHLWMLHDVVVV